MRVKPGLAVGLVLMLALGLAVAPVRAVAETDTWTAIGPLGGTVTALAVDPRNDRLVLAGTDAAGVWRSANGGAAWLASGGGLSDAAITALVADPDQAGVWYAGTGSSGVFKSANGGTSWAAASHGLKSGKLAALAAGPAAGELWAAVAGVGLFVSRNAAASWSETRPMVDGIDVTAILVGGDGTIFLGTSGAFSGGSYVLASRDDGATWQASAIAGLSSPVTGLTFDPTAPATIYLGSTFQGVFRSRDAGAHWSAAGRLQNPAVTALAADAKRAGVLYAATQDYLPGGGSRVSGGVFRSLNGGATWQRVGQGMAAVTTPSTTITGAATGENAATGGSVAIGSQAEIGAAATSPTAAAGAAALAPSLNTLSLAADPRQTGVVYAGNALTGVFKSSNFAGSWLSEPKGMRALAMAQVAVDPARPERIFAGSTTTGLYRSLDGGADWQQLIPGVDVQAILINPSNSQQVYAGTFSGVYRSSNGGNHWAVSQPQSAFAGGLALDPTRPTTVYAGTLLGVYRSLDGAATWSAPANPNALPCLQPLAIAVDPGTPSQVFVGGTDLDIGCTQSNPNVLLDVSRDSGVHWHQIGAGLGSFDDLVFSADAATLYAALGGGVSSSTDDGATWQATGLAAAGHEIDVLALDPHAPQAPAASGLYAGDFASGVYWSGDGGGHWLRLPDPLASRNVTGLAPSPTAGVLYVAGAGGLFRVERQH